MADLAKILENQGYDLMIGSVRGQGVLQIWRKRFNNSIESWYDNIGDAFIGDIKSLPISTADAVNVNANSKQELQFYIGLTALDQILEKGNLGKLELGTKVSKGSSLTITYSGAFTEEVETSKAAIFLSGDFKHPNSILFNDLVKDNLILITGVLYAKNLSAVLEDSHITEIGLEANVKTLTDGKVKLEQKGESKIELTAELGQKFPIAVKYHRIVYKKGKFKDLRLMSDTKNWFE